VSLLVPPAEQPHLRHGFRPNELSHMRAIYGGLPGVKVKPLHFAPNDISGDRLLAMMKVGDGARAYMPFLLLAKLL
jgi:hypothetical protein